MEVWFPVPPVAKTNIADSSTRAANKRIVFIMDVLLIIE